MASPSTNKIWDHSELVEKSRKMPPDGLPPSLPLNGVESGLLHLQHDREHLTNTQIHHGPLITNVCITAHSHRSSRTLHRNHTPTPSILWSKSIFNDSEWSQFFCTAYLHHTNQTCQIWIITDGFCIFWNFSIWDAQKRPHITNVATYVENHWNLACSPYMASLVATKIWDHSKLVE